jgi:hypothetical protein
LIKTGEDVEVEPEDEVSKRGKKIPAKIFSENSSNRPQQLCRTSCRMYVILIFFLLISIAGFLIKTRDSQGKRIRKGGHPITAKLTGDGKTRTDLHDNKDGTYLMRFRPNHEVTYNFEVRYSEEEIAGSPFLARIHESKKEIVRR